MKEANVLFVDNPVGSGYSYVDNASLLTTDIHQTTYDLTQFTMQFMIRYPEFKVIIIKPFYVVVLMYLTVRKHERPQAWARGHLSVEKAKM